MIDCFNYLRKKFYYRCLTGFYLNKPLEIFVTTDFIEVRAKIYKSLFSLCVKFSTHQWFLENFGLFAFNPFVLSAPVLYPLKTSETFWYFQGVEKWCIGNKWVKRIRTSSLENSLGFQTFLISLHLQIHISACFRNILHKKFEWFIIYNIVRNTTHAL